MFGEESVHTDYNMNQIATSTSKSLVNLHETKESSKEKCA